MSLLPRRGTCFSCGHNHGDGYGSPKELELIGRIAELERQVAELREGSQEPVGCTDDDGIAWAYNRDGGRFMPNIKLYAESADHTDAKRWREVLKHVGGTHTDTGAQRFTLRYLNAVEGANIMRGGVAEHFTNAIDAALAQAKKEGSNNG